MRESARGLRATNWPLRDAPVRSLASLMACIAIAVGCAVLSHSVSMGLLAGLAMTLALWKLWLPVTTEFEPRGIVLTALGRRRRIAWREIDHLELREGGVFLCTQSLPLHRAALRSVFLPCGEDRESIATFCEEYRPLGLSDWSGH